MGLFLIIVSFPSKRKLDVLPTNRLERMHLILQVIALLAMLDSPQTRLIPEFTKKKVNNTEISEINDLICVIAGLLAA